MYEKIEVWHRSKNNDLVYVFFCFRDIESNKFYVQSVDGLYPDSSEADKKTIYRYRVEAFLDQDIKEKETGFSSLSDAINAAFVWADIPR